MTGVSMFIITLDAKRLELLRELLPTARTFGVLVNRNNVPAELHAKELQAAARTTGQQLIVLGANSDADFVELFNEFVRQRTDGLIIVPDPLFDSRRDQLVDMAARHAVPTIYGWREFAAAAA
jgi:putative ABC transport system substrate-binding protein